MIIFFDTLHTTENQNENKLIKPNKTLLTLSYWNVKYEAATIRKTKQNHTCENTKRFEFVHANRMEYATNKSHNTAYTVSF